MATEITFGIEGGQGLQTSNVNTGARKEAPHGVTLSACFQRKVSRLVRGEHRSERLIV